MSHFSGEINSLRKAFHETFGEKRDLLRQKSIVKQVIGCMTLGIDASSLFTEMIMACETKDLVQKKMVYQYLSYYAKEKQDLALLMINTLSKDFGDGNPLVRGLALRTMTSLHIPYLLEHILPRLKQGLLDWSPYVRKTAAIGVAKMLPTARPHVSTPQIIDRLHEMIEDPDPQVCSNALAALEEVLMNEVVGGVRMTETRVLHLLSRFHHFNSWSQSFILQLILKYEPKSQEEVLAVLNLLDPFLKASEANVVLAIAKVFIKFTSGYPNLHSAVFPRLKDPLMTMTSGANNETVFVILSHFLILADKQPLIICDLYKKFYLKPTDPNYLKSIKIEILQLIARHISVAQLSDIINEFSFYISKEKSPSIIHLTVQAMTSIISARKLAKSLNTQQQNMTNTATSTNRNEPLLHPSTALAIAEHITNELVQHLDIDWTCASDAAMAGLKNVLRNFPQFANKILPKATSAWINQEERPTINSASSAIAEESFLWILGEFGSAIPEAPYLIEPIISNYNNLNPRVKLQLLTATTKLFFKRPPEVHKSLLKLLDLATGDPSIPDVHDRALFITRLLATDLNLAEKLFTTATLPIESYQSDLDSEMKDLLLEEFNTLSVLYREPSKSFIREYSLLEIDEEREHQSPPPITRTTASPSAEHLQTNSGSYVAPSNPTQTHVPSSPVNYSPQTSSPITTIASPAKTVSTPQEIKMGQLKPAVNLQSKVFETMWKSLPLVIAQKINFVPRVQNAKELEASFKEFRIFTVASGIKGGFITLYSYAQLDAAPSSYVLIEFKLEISAGQLNLTLKSDNKDFAESFQLFFKRVLSEFE